MAGFSAQGLTRRKAMCFFLQLRSFSKFTWSLVSVPCGYMTNSPGFIIALAGGYPQLLEATTEQFTSWLFVSLRPAGGFLFSLQSAKQPYNRIQSKEWQLSPFTYRTGWK